MTEELAKIYHHICTTNNITPSRVMLEHSKGEIVLTMMLVAMPAFLLLGRDEIDIQVIHNL